MNQLEYRIVVEPKLSSYAFYNNILKQLHNYLLEMTDDATETVKELIFDFSNTQIINPLVIPNLLCVGFFVKDISNQKAKIFVPNNLMSGKIKGFMHQSNFVSLARTYNLFDFDDSIDGGYEIIGKRKNLNTTISILYDGKDKMYESADKIELTLKKNLWPFLNTFVFESDKKYQKFENSNEYKTLDQKTKNTIFYFCKEICENSILHGQSFCFLNMQFIPMGNMPKIFISLSDCGRGLKNSINDDIRRSQQLMPLYKSIENASDEDKLSIDKKISDIQLNGCRLRTEDVSNLCNQDFVKDDLEGIIRGLLTRKQNKDYGIYSVYDRVCLNGGTIRIHSRSTQLILTNHLAFELEVAKNPAEFLEILEKNNYDSNVRQNLTFSGTHIELEILL